MELNIVHSINQKPITAGMNVVDDEESYAADSFIIHFN